MKITKRWRIFLLTGLLIGVVLDISENVAAAAEEANQQVEYEAGFYYTIQKGDTLWDLSQRFNDTPWQWPDLWQENTQIPNPHWIYPGERIRLFRKKDQHRFQTAQKEAPVAVPVPEVTASVPVEQPKPQVNYWYANMDRVGFIRKPAVQPLGVIFKSRDDKKLISKGDLVYIRHPELGQNLELSPGMRLTAYRTLSPVDSRHAETNIGSQHFLLGIVEITKNESQFALAKVIRSFRHIQTGDQVMAYQPRNPQIAVVDSTPGIAGTIIAGEDHTKIMGDLFIAFIDKGAQDNILPGQIYNIFYQEMESIGPGGRNVPLDKVDIGSVLVLHTEQTTSTVVVTDSMQQIKPGQAIRTP